MFKMLRQIPGIDIVEYKADFGFLKTAQESFHHVMNIHEQFAVPVMRSRPARLSDVQDRPAIGGVSLVV